MINASEQIAKLDSIYIEFLKTADNYDNNTIIPGLYDVLVFISQSVRFRDIMYLDSEPVNEETIFVYEEILKNSEEISNFTFIYSIAHILKTISDSDLNILNIVNDNVLQNKGNKYFFYPIISKTGKFAISTISKMLIGDETDNGLTPSFSKIPLGIICKSKTTSGPHYNMYNNPIDFLHHDSRHFAGVFLNSLEKNDISLFRRIYARTKIDKYMENIFHFVIWTYLFEENTDQGFTHFLLDKNRSLYVDDYEYCIKYLKKYAPEQRERISDEDFINLCIDDLVNFLNGIDII